MKTTTKVFGLLAFSVLLGCTGVYAGNPEAKASLSGNQARKFKMPDNLDASGYIAKTIIVKIDPAQKSSLNRTAITVPSLQASFALLGVQQMNAVYPNAGTVASRNVYGRTVDLSTIYKLNYTADISVEDAINELYRSADVVYAEPSYIYKLSYIPNDPDTANSRNYYQKLIKAYEAWNVTKGDTNVVIGIVDTGGDLDHPDLAANVKYNYNDPVDGIDNDNDGYIDNFMGWDFVGPTDANFVPDGDPNVKSGGNDHGVHVGGDASAVADNNTGIAGIGFKSKLLFIKCAPDAYSNSVYTGYEGIVYAADHGASVINCSWGGPGGGSYGQEVIDYAISKGALVVAAAGNDGIETSQYPSSFQGVLSVASTTNTDRRSSFSNFGYDVDVSAPGSSIYSTTFNNAYNSYSGTSMASPIVAGAAALVKSVFPAYNPLQIGEQLRVTCDDINNLNPAQKDKLGKGRINVFRAVTESSPSIRNTSRTLADNSNGAMLPGDNVSLFGTFTNFLKPTSALTVTLSTTSANVTVTNGVVNLGAVGMMQSVDAPSPFTFTVSNSASENAVINFKLAYSDGSYTDAEFFTVIVNVSSLNITVNEVQSTSTGVGRVGYRNGDATGGLGFAYKGENMLYEASFMVAKSATQVSNNARTESATPDNHFVIDQRVYRVIDTVADFYSRGSFTDAASPNPINLKVKHRELAWSPAPDNKYIIVEYKIQNMNTSALSNIYAGLFVDWDIVDAAANRNVYDHTNRMGYAYTSKAGDPYAAVKVLSNTAPVNYYGQSHSIPGDPQENGYSIAEKYLTLSSGIMKDSMGMTGTGIDVMYSIGAGPYTLNPSEEAVVAFAFIGGDNLADLQASAQAAQNKYDNLVLNLGLNGKKANTSLGIRLQPNPAQGQVKVSFQLSSESKTTLTIYDQLGRKVKTIFENTLFSGPYSVDADISDLDAGIYFMTVQSGTSKETGKLIVSK